MSSGIATVIALAIYGVAVTPFALMAWRPGHARWLAGLSAALVLGLCVFQTGLFQQDALASTDVARLVRQDSLQSRCKQVFDVLRENGVLLESPGPQGLVVRGAAWDQLPPPVMEAVQTCALPFVSASDPSHVPVTRR